jgi:chromosome segregation ATPase
MLRALMALTLGFSFALAAGCGEEQQAPPAQSPQTQGAAPAPAQQEPAQEKEQYTKAVQKELDEIKLDIEALKSQATAASVESKEKLKQEVSTLEQKWEVAEKQFDDLKEASGDAWRDIRPSLEATVTELRQTLSNAKGSA